VAATRFGHGINPLLTEEFVHAFAGGLGQGQSKGAAGAPSGLTDVFNLPGGGRLTKGKSLRLQEARPAEVLEAKPDKLSFKLTLNPMAQGLS